MPTPPLRGRTAAFPLAVLMLAAACGEPDPALSLRAISFANAAAQEAAPQPDPSLTPADVVRIQLDALRNNDELAGNSGIAVAFAFASPANRAITGPLDRFVDFVNSPEYRPMLNHRRADTGPLITSGDLAEQRVVVVGAGGERVTYVFVLARQQRGPFAGCWLTEGVLRTDEETPMPEGIKRV